MEFSVFDLVLIVVFYVLIVYVYSFYKDHYSKLSRVYGILKEVKQEACDSCLESTDWDFPTRRERRRRTTVRVR
uniref:Putative transmembrane protein n=1 Tax=Persimmon virus B TaxID=1493829 RepID=A0A0A8JEP4_9CLOS|nr:putative transmembrane protein [Persimmon virus B]